MKELLNSCFWMFNLRISSTDSDFLWSSMISQYVVKTNSGFDWLGLNNTMRRWKISNCQNRLFSQSLSTLHKQTSCAGTHLSEAARCPLTWGSIAGVFFYLYTIRNISLSLSLSVLAHFQELWKTRKRKVPFDQIADSALIDFNFLLQPRTFRYHLFRLF